MKQHPLSAAFPAMSDSDFDSLVDDIKTHGQREAIIVFDGAVLDGWHRYQACKVAKVECATMPFPGGDPVAFVLSRNLHRRHLTESQRAVAVVSASNWKPHGGGRKTGQVPHVALDRTTAEMAKAADVSVHTIRNAKEAVKAGLADKVRDGEMSVRAAAESTRPAPTEAARKPAKPSKEEELAAQVAEMREALAEAADEIQRLAAIKGEGDDPGDLMKNLQAELRAVTARRDDLMRENSQLKEQINILKRQLAKAQKQ
jgi:hypothetical protein